MTVCKNCFSKVKTQKKLLPSIWKAIDSGSNTNRAATKGCTKPGCCTAKTDASSDGVDPTLAFVIKFSMSYPTRPCSPCHTQCRLWGTLLRRGLRFVQWRRTLNPVKERDPIVDRRMESPSTSLSFQSPEECNNARSAAKASFLKIVESRSHV